MEPTGPVLRTVWAETVSEYVAGVWGVPLISNAEPFDSTLKPLVAEKGLLNCRLVPVVEGNPSPGPFDG